MDIKSFATWALILHCLIVATALSAQAESVDFWLDEKYGVENGNGSLQTPFRTVQQFSNYVVESGIQSRPIRLYTAPGVYIDPSLSNLLRNITFLPCEVCPGQEYDRSSVLFEMRHTKEFWRSMRDAKTFFALRHIVFSGTNVLPTDLNAIFAISNGTRLFLDHVTFENFISPHSLIKGDTGSYFHGDQLTVRNNTLNARYGSSLHAAGLFYRDQPLSHLTLSDCLFESNTLQANTTEELYDSPAFQGGIITAQGEVSILRSTFLQNGISLNISSHDLLKRQNEAACGGVMALYGLHNIIMDSQFEDNFVVMDGSSTNLTRGGVICFGQWASLGIDNTSFIHNSAGSGGVIASSQTLREEDLYGEVGDIINSLTITNSLFEENSCSSRGCAIDFMPLKLPSVLEIEDTTFSDNVLRLSSNLCDSALEDSQNDVSDREHFERLQKQTFSFQTSSLIPTTISSLNRSNDNRQESDTSSNWRRTARQWRPKSLASPDSALAEAAPGTFPAALGGVAIAVVGVPQYFSTPKKVTVALSHVSFLGNWMKGKCPAYGLAVLLHKVASVGFNEVKFDGQSSDLADSVVSMSHISSILASNVGFSNNAMYWQNLGRGKVALWNIEGQGSLPSSIEDESASQSDFFVHERSGKRQKSLFGEIAKLFPSQSQKTFYQIQNLTFENNVARDALLHCTAVHSIRLKGCNWQNLKIPKLMLLPFKTSLLWLRSISSNVYIEDSSVETTELPIVIAYVGETVFLTKSNFSSFTGSQTALVTLHQATSVNIAQCNWISNSATAVSISSSTAAIHDSNFFNNSSPAFAGAIRFSAASGFIVSSNFTRNTGLNGGAVSTNSALQIFGSLFRLNHALTSGGAIMVVSAPSLIIDHVICTENWARVRGGCLAMSGDDSNVWMNKFKSYPQGEILGIKARAASTQLIAKFSSFSYNSAATGGAVSLYNGVKSQLSETSFFHNSATDQGGAIEFWVPLLFSGISSTQPMQRVYGMAPAHLLVRCNFTLNWAGDHFEPKIELTDFQDRPLPPGSSLPSGIGGAIIVHQAELTLINCSLEGNVAFHSGGALYGANILRTSLSVQACNFTLNTALISGGALAVGEQAIETITYKYLLCNLGIKDVIFEANSANYGGAFSWAPAANCSNNQLTGDNAYLSRAVFINNNATQSGGAIVAVGHGVSDFYSYSNLSMVSNRAKSSGSHFFYNFQPTHDLLPTQQWLEAQNPPIFCQPDLCSVSPDSDSKPFWGPVHASSFWRIEYDLAPLEQVRTVQPLSLQYRLLDLYQQIVTEPLFLSVDIEPFDGSADPRKIKKNDFSIQASQIPYSGMEFNGITNSSLILSLGVSERYARDPLMTFRRNSTNPFVSPVNVSAIVQLHPRSYTNDPNAFYLVGQVLQTRAYRCPVGFGLWRLPSADSLFGCLPCPIGTYNFNGDGQCYSCHDASIQLNCQTDTVTALAGFWSYVPHSASKTPSSSGQITNTPTADSISNELFIAKCRPGQCLTGKCATDRNGIMCSGCVEGTWESLFSDCSSVCHHPSTGFLILALLLLVIATFAFHYFINLVPVTTLHYSSSIVLGMMLMHPSLDWALPKVSKSLSAFLCGFRATSVQRMIFFSFAPYAAIPLLLAAYLLINLTQRILKCDRFAFIATVANQVSGLKILKSIGGLCLVLSISSLRAALDWTQCTKTPSIGNRWVFAPSVLCTSEAFKSGRLASLLALIPLSIIPIIIACASIGSELFPRKTKIFSKFLSPISQVISNPLSGTLSRVSIILDLVGKSLISMVAALMVQEERFRSIMITGILVLLMMLNALGSPFLTMLERIAGTLSFGFLAVIAAAEPNFFNNPAYPLITFGLYIFWMTTMAIVFTVGHRKAEQRLAIAVAETNWEEIDHSDHHIQSNAATPLLFEENNVL